MISRSSHECHLYIELHPCECGDRRFPNAHKLVSVDDGLLAVYEGACTGCGVSRRFEFLLDPELPPGDKFGGSRPSSIIDAGQYMAIADAAAMQVPADVTGLDAEAKRNARWWMNRAVNALEEVLKWDYDEEGISPQGLFTESGTATYEIEPGRFRKERVEAVVETYRRLLTLLKA